MKVGFVLFGSLLLTAGFIVGRTDFNTKSSDIETPEQPSSTNAGTYRYFASQKHKDDLRKAEAQRKQERNAADVDAAYRRQDAIARFDTNFLPLSDSDLPSFEDPFSVLDGVSARDSLLVGTKKANICRFINDEKTYFVEVKDNERWIIYFNFRGHVSNWNPIMMGHKDETYRAIFAGREDLPNGKVLVKVDFDEGDMKQIPYRPILSQQCQERHQQVG